MKNIIQSVKQKVWQGTCAILLPMSTNCKVCNMLRGAALGFALCLIMCISIACLLLPVRGG